MNIASANVCQNTHTSGARDAQTYNLSIGWASFLIVFFSYKIVLCFPRICVSYEDQAWNKRYNVAASAHMADCNCILVETWQQCSRDKTFLFPSLQVNRTHIYCLPTQKCLPLIGCPVAVFSSSRSPAISHWTKSSKVLPQMTEAVSAYQMTQLYSKIHFDNYFIPPSRRSSVVEHSRDRGFDADHSDLGFSCHIRQMWRWNPQHRPWSTPSRILAPPHIPVWVLDA